MPCLLLLTIMITVIITIKATIIDLSMKCKMFMDCKQGGQWPLYGKQRYKTARICGISLKIIMAISIKKVDSKRKDFVNTHTYTLR